MKRKIVVSFLVAFMFLLSSSVSAQSFDNLANALRTGNSSALAQSFSGNVEITIKDAEASYSKSQAEMVLKSFFTSHVPKSFAIAHQGTSPEGSKYFIGNLATSLGNYRTYVYAKSVNGTLVVQEIRFEEQ